MAENQTQTPADPSDAPPIPPDELPERDEEEVLVDDETDDDEMFEEDLAAGMRIVDGPSDPEPFEQPGRQVAGYEDERAVDSRARLDEWLETIRSTRGAEGKVEIDRTGPRNIPEAYLGRLSTVRVTEIENDDVGMWLKQEWGGGVFKLVVRDARGLYRGTVEIRVAGLPRMPEIDELKPSSDSGLVSVVKELVDRIGNNTNTGGGEVLRMMEMRMAEEREDRKAQAERDERESRERIEQIKADSAAQIQLITTIMANNAPKTDPLELALKLADSQTKGLMRAAEFSSKAMERSMVGAIDMSGKVNSSIVTHALGTLRSMHDSEADQTYLDKIMNVASTLGGPAQEAIKAVMAGKEPAPPAAASPAPAAAPDTPAPPVADAPPPPPPGPGGELPTVEHARLPEPPAENEASEQEQRIAMTGVLITLQRASVFVEALTLQATTDPDPEEAWSEMKPLYDKLPGKLRERIETETEELPESDSLDELLPMGQQLLAIFEDLAGEPTAGEAPLFAELRERIEILTRTILADTSRAVWLRDFFEVAPWVELIDDAPGDPITEPPGDPQEEEDPNSASGSAIETDGEEVSDGAADLADHADDR